MKKKSARQFNTIYRVFTIFLCFLFLNPLFAQYEAENELRRQQYMENIQPNYCGTKDLPANVNSKAIDIAISERLQNLRSSNAGTWNLNDGYGSSCVQNCAITNSSSCSANNDLFRIPVVYTLSNSSCSTSIPSTAELQAQIDIMNDFYVCQGLDIFYYLPTNIAAAPGGVRVGAFGCNYDNNTAADLPNVINVYVFSDTGNGTGCNGFAPLPFSTGSSTAIVMSHNCYNNYVYTPGSLNCNNVNMGLGQVLVHEFGHYLGLYHTHRANEFVGLDANGDPVFTNGNCDDPSTSADDCTQGDLIQDTDEDPDFSGGEIGCTGCNTGGPSSSCTFNNASPECQPYGSPNTLDNIMSYNLFSGCINDFSSCQKAKMMDALLCVRGLQACNRDVNMEFANGASDANQQICIGDPIPTFVTTGSCYMWFDGLGASANQVASGSSFTPNASQVDVNTPGIYTFYLGDFNEYNPSCRTEISVTVFPSAGEAQNNGSNAALDACSGSPFTFSANGANVISNDNMVGWHFSDDNPTTITSQSGITAAISNATNSSTLNLANGNVIQSNIGTPLTSLSGLGVDCAALQTAGGDGTYYLTPFVAFGDQSVTCTGFGSSNGVVWNFGGSGMHGGATSSEVDLSSCNGNITGLTGGDVMVTVTVDTYTGNNTSGLIRFDIREGGSCGGISTAGSVNLNCPSTPCSVNITQAQLDANMGDGDFNPLTDAFCISAVDFPSDNTTNISYTISAQIMYSGDNAVTVWNSNGGPDIGLSSGNSDPSCFWGTPVQITCPCGGNPCPADYAGGGALSGTESGTTDYETDGSIESTQVVLSGAVVDYDAGTDITLLPNFEVILGAQFSAFIDGCGGMMIQENESQTTNK